MTKLYFECEFLSNVVLHASSNTEGKITLLDFIPGSNFLGMAAREYGRYDDNFAVFHSGKVRFGDGHIVIGDQESYPVPFSWFASKESSTKEAIQNGEITNRHLTQESYYEEQIKEGRQPKQQRVGYITQSGAYKRIEHRYSQKSAREQATRRAKKGAMFGYYALPKGTIWRFCVEIDEGVSEDDENKIIDTLQASTRLGKSKSAEYGHVKITCLKDKDCPSPEGDKEPIEYEGEHYIFLYAYSRLALTDENGIETYNPTPQGLGFDENDHVEIDIAKSNIRTSRYTPYVSVRHNYDPERLLIDKGSVIAVKVPQDFDVSAYEERIASGVGLYRSEGFGKILINPSFISTSKPFENGVTTIRQSNSDQENSSNTAQDANSKLTQWLKAQREAKEQDVSLVHEVDVFIKKHPVSGKKSQWGQIRALCNASKNNGEIYSKLFDETIKNGHPKGFLLHGKAMEKWDKANLIDKIKEKYDPQNKEGTDFLRFVKLLSIHAPKKNDEKEGGQP